MAVTVVRRFGPGPAIYARKREKGRVSEASLFSDPIIPEVAPCPDRTPDKKQSTLFVSVVKLLLSLVPNPTTF